MVVASNYAYLKAGQNLAEQAQSAVDADTTKRKMESACTSLLGLE